MARILMHHLGTNIHFAGCLLETAAPDVNVRSVWSCIEAHYVKWAIYL